MKNGDIVTVVLKTPWATTEERLKVVEINETEIYIENLNIPFNKKTGYKTESMAGSSVYIKEITKK